MVIRKTIVKSEVEKIKSKVYYTVTCVTCGEEAKVKVYETACPSEVVSLLRHNRGWTTETVNDEFVNIKCPKCSKGVVN